MGKIKTNNYQLAWHSVMLWNPQTWHSNYVNTLNSKLDIQTSIHSKFKFQFSCNLSVKLDTLLCFEIHKQITWKLKLEFSEQNNMVGRIQHQLINLTVYHTENVSFNFHVIWVSSLKIWNPKSNLTLYCALKSQT